MDTLDISSNAQNVAETAIIAGSLVAIVVIGLIAWVFVQLFGRRQQGSTQMDEDEARLIQELHRGFERMEQRVEALETLMLDRERKRPS